jgi:hypothetical protein
MLVVVQVAGLPQSHEVGTGRRGCCTYPLYPKVGISVPDISCKRYVSAGTTKPAHSWPEFNLLTSQPAAERLQQAHRTVL